MTKIQNMKKNSVGGIDKERHSCSLLLLPQNMLLLNRHDIPWSTALKSLVCETPRDTFQIWGYMIQKVSM